MPHLRDDGFEPDRDDDVAGSELVRPWPPEPSRCCTARDERDPDGRARAERSPFGNDGD